MNQATAEERVREFIGAERARIRPPQGLPAQILDALENAHATRSARPVGPLRTAAAGALVLTIALATVGLRALERPGAAAIIGSWTGTTSMVVGRGYQTATLLPDGDVLVVGGSQTIRALGSAELYNPASRRWRPAGSLSIPRLGLSATLLKNGKVLVAGGSDSDIYSLNALASAELYDPRTNSWSAAASMHVARAFHTASLLPNGRVLVVGGYATVGIPHNIVLSSAEVYDPDLDLWSVAAPAPEPRALHAAVVLDNGKILVVGGSDLERAGGSGVRSASMNSAHLYDPITNSWSATASMRYARTSPTATLLPNGRVLVVGDDGVNERTAEIYDPARNQWTNAPRPSDPRAEAVAVRLSNGNVLVAGGIAESSASIFDWRTNAWTSAGNMRELRASAAGTLLANGQVLVTGGFANREIPFASAELFDPQAHQLISERSPSVPTFLDRVSPIVGGAALLILIGAWLLSRTARRRRPDAWVN